MKKRKHKYKIPEIQKIGVYAIRNTITGKMYIGSSINVYTRMKTQARALYNTGINSLFDEDIEKTGYNSFEFLVLETFEDNTITDKQLRDRERFYMGKYDTRRNGYNHNDTWECARVNKGLISCNRVVIPGRKSAENVKE